MEYICLKTHSQSPLIQQLHSCGEWLRTGKQRLTENTSSGKLRKPETLQHLGEQPAHPGMLVLLFGGAWPATEQQGQGEATAQQIGPRAPGRGLWMGNACQVKE